MHAQARIRALCSALLSLALALPTLAGFASTARADGFLENVVISEINFAGSYGNPTDQWMEFYNTTTGTIDLSGYRLLANGATLITFPAASQIMPHHTLLVTRLTTSPSLVIIPADIADPKLVLPTHDVQYVLEDASATPMVSDRADTGTGAPLAGHDGGISGGPVASMARQITLSATGTATVVDGAQKAAWYTSRTVGGALASGAMVYGTPESSAFNQMAGPNPDIAAPINLALSPAAPITTGNTVTVSGALEAGQTSVILADIRFHKVVKPAVQDIVIPQFLDSATHTFSASMPSLDPGIWQASVSVRDGYAPFDSSAVVPVPTGTPQNTFVVQSSANVVVPPPVLDQSYPKYVSTVQNPTVTLTGTSQAGTIVVSINGKDYQETAQVTQANPAFSLVVNLIPNTVNTIELRAKDALGHTSDPVEAVITHDTIAPNPVNYNKVIVTANPVGTPDTVQGLPDAAEPGATVEIYSDLALTQRVGSALVAPDGSFAQTGVGSGKYMLLYLLVRDKSGNADPANVRTFALGTNLAGLQVPLGVMVSNIGTDQATISWQAVPGAAGYRVKYKVDGGAYGTPVDLCMAGGTCMMQRLLSGLSSGTSYSVAMAAIDAFGHESAYSEQAFKTASPAVVAVATSTPTPAPAATSPAATSTPTPTPAPRGSAAPAPAAGTTATPTPAPSPSASPTPSATPSPTPEQGSVKSAETDNGTAARNYTPWIILGVLLLLAVLATLAYFYWFGGEAGDEAMASAESVRQQEDAAAAKAAADKPASPEKPADQQPPKDGKPSGREKRW